MHKIKTVNQTPHCAAGTHAEVNTGSTLKPGCRADGPERRYMNLEIRVPLESGFFLSLVKGRSTWHLSFPPPTSRSRAYLDVPSQRPKLLPFLDYCVEKADTEH